MKTFKTIEDAKKDTNSFVVIIQIDHADEGLIYIKAKCGIGTLRKVLAKKPMKEIKKLIKECREESKEITKTTTTVCPHCGTYCHSDCRS